MPSPELIAAFDAASMRHSVAVADLVPLLIEVALAAVAEVLPGAEVLETEGEMNEDWAFTLRIQRVLDANGDVLYDIGAGHDDPEAVEIRPAHRHPVIDVREQFPQRRPISHCEMLTYEERVLPKSRWSTVPGRARPLTTVGLNDSASR